ncbi:hypothetical protein [Streptomyces sp. CT34]|uniref:hypothetical protein n=1 Tax=Streptomyces sp. CT34 TaxID=1553907 RepID=UPI0005B946F0|nr:hypothetical protein [Streptomyces sp. CT34]
MSALTHHPIRYAGAPARLIGRLLARFTRIVRRLTDSPLDHTVLHATSARTTAPSPAKTSAPARLHAQWRIVTGDDVCRHLEASWHTGA